MDSPNTYKSYFTQKMNMVSRMLCKLGFQYCYQKNIREDKIPWVHPCEDASQSVRVRKL